MAVYITVIGIVIGVLFILSWVINAVFFRNRYISSPLPSHGYEEALEKLFLFQEQDDSEVNPACRTHALLHGKKTDRVIVLYHGITNCPKQFHKLGDMFYKKGYNVFIPRMPRNGMKDRMTTELVKLTTEELRQYADKSVDIATGMGNEVYVMGLSASGVVAAWIAQHRPDVKRVMLIGAAFGVTSSFPQLHMILMHILLALPNIATQGIMPFTGAPDHTYLGHSTRALATVMKLGTSVFISAWQKKPAAESIIVVMNDNDIAVDDRVTRDLIRVWKRKKKKVETYTFPKNMKVAHDMIDPSQQFEKTSLVYPKLIELLEEMNE
jgi:carboxylesterase